MRPWILNLYKAAEDPTATPYTSVALTTVQGYTGYASLQDVYIVAPQATWDFESNELIDIGGWKQTTPIRRRKFDVECYPFRYDDSPTVPDLTDVDTISAFLASAKFMWLSIDAGTRQYPTTSGHVIPVNLLGFDESINKRAGTRSLIITFDAKGLG